MTAHVPIIIQPRRIPTIFAGLGKPKRYKVFWGGRGSGKTYSFSDTVSSLCMVRYPIKGEPFRVLCGREFQNSMAESVYFEIRSAISRKGMTPYFKYTNGSIICKPTGATILFRGTHNNIDQIKSLGGIDLFWGEEAHSMTADSLTYIDPTIRRDAPYGPFGQGSELWLTFNQSRDDDPVYAKFKCQNGAWEDARTLVVPCTWKDNWIGFKGPQAMRLAHAAYPDLPAHKFVQIDPMTVHVLTFPDVLDALRQDSKANDPEAHYEWVWGTQCRNLGGIFFALKDLLVDNKPIEYPTICDAVFAVIDTATKTGREHDGTAVQYNAISRHGTGFPLQILDYDIMQIEGRLLETWLPNVIDRCKELANQCRARIGVLGIFIEDKASGMVLLQQAKNRNLPVHAIESKLTAMGKTERAIVASPHVTRGHVKYTRHAFDKTVMYKGVNRNHSVGQVTQFRIGDTETDEDDLTDCFSYSIAIGLGNESGF